MIVVDTQMLVYAATPNPNAEMALRVALKDPDWRTSTLWRSEFRNVLAGGMRRGSFDAAFRCLARHLPVHQSVTDQEDRPDPPGCRRDGKQSKRRHTWLRHRLSGGRDVQSTRLD